MINKKVVLFTAEFPYGTGETFLETELIFLSRAFNEVVIVPQNTDVNHIRIIPANCQIEQITIKYSLQSKIRSCLNIFSPITWKELKIIKTVYKKKISPGILKTMLVSFERAKKIKNYINTYSEKQVKTTLFYSYWCDDAALGIALANHFKKNIKGISRAHGWDTYFDSHSINYLPFRRFISENLIALFPISNKGKQIIKSVWKAKTNNISVARLGITNSFKSNRPEGFFKIVSCSNIIPLKRIHLIIEALNLIGNKAIEWTHFGDGFLMEEILKHSNNLPKTITMNFKGRVSNNEIYKSYSTSQPHLFINVSSSEGIPVSIMEAMSFGIPVIATDVGGNSEIVTNDNGVLLSENPTSKEIALQIMRFWEMNEDEYSLYSKNALKTWNEKYNAEKNYSVFISYILNLE